MAKTRKLRTTRRVITEYVTLGARVARSSGTPKDVIDDPTITLPPRDTTYTGPDTTPTNNFEMNTDTPSLPPLHQSCNEALVFYGAFFASTMASLVPREMYMKIAAHMCGLTNAKFDTRNWYRSVTSRYKHIFDKKEAVEKLRDVVKPHDVYRMNGVWTIDGRDVEITTASVSTKLEWLRLFLKDTHTLRVRLLTVPYHPGLENFIAECLVNNVIVVHETAAFVGVAPSPVYVDTHEADTIDLDDVEPGLQKLDNGADTRDSSSASDTRADYSNDDISACAEVLETAEADDTMTELPCNQLVLVSRQPSEEEDVLNICKSFSEKALAYPSGDVLKLLEHVLEERNKLILKVISVEMELKAARGS